MLKVLKKLKMPKNTDKNCSRKKCNFFRDISSIFDEIRSSTTAEVLSYCILQIYVFAKIKAKWKGPDPEQIPQTSKQLI